MGATQKKPNQLLYVFTASADYQPRDFYVCLCPLHARRLMAKRRRGILVEVEKDATPEPCQMC